LRRALDRDEKRLLQRVFGGRDVVRHVRRDAHQVRRDVVVDLAQGAGGTRAAKLVAELVPELVDSVRTRAQRPKLHPASASDSPNL